MNQRHSTGDWTYTMQPDGTLFELRAGDTMIIYGCGCCGSPLVGGDAEANARLIAAAPDLFAACEAALELLTDQGFAFDDEPPTPEVVQIRAALAKARGDAQSPHNSDPSVT